VANLADTYSWAADETDLKAWLGVTSTTEDAELERWYNVAIAFGDNSGLVNDFTDSDGDDETHPAGIQEGLFEYVKAARARFIAIKGGRVQGSYEPGDDEARAGMAAAMALWAPWSCSVLGWMGATSS
jgi:hypothetical protein